MSQKRIYIINTGGTIGMKSTDRGFRPVPGYLLEQMNALPELHAPEMPRFEMHEYPVLLDSSNIKPENWLAIAQDIADNYERFDGFIVLHGTDTMAYTTSALPFMLRGLSKSVIVTGSQIPLCLPRNDARENLVTALMLAGRYEIPEVCLYFGGQLLRGCRATKISTSDFVAFRSPNYQPLGVAGTRLIVHRNRWRKSTGESELTVDEIRPAAVATFRLFPGLSVEVLRNVLAPPLDAIILEAYGVGNGPSRNEDFLKAIATAAEQGILVAVCTQCEHGGVFMDDYATGRAMLDAGAISCGDMTIEAAISKIHYLYSRNLSLNEVKRQFQSNLVGELTETED